MSETKTKLKDVKPKNPKDPKMPTFAGTLPAFSSNYDENDQNEEKETFLSKGSFDAEDLMQQNREKMKNGERMNPLDGIRAKILTGPRKPNNIHVFPVPDKKYKGDEYEKPKNKKYKIGINLVEEALKNNVVKELYLIEQNLKIAKNFTNCFLISKEISQKISKVNADQGIFAICFKKPQEIDLESNTLVLDNIQDPGNLGTLIRSAYAFGFKNIVCSKETVNFYNQKVLRSIQGNHFNLNIIYEELELVLKKLKSNKYNIYGTILNNDYVSLDSIENSKLAIVLGNEGNGISNELSIYFDKNIKINTINEIESLNVAIAGSIIMTFINGELIDNGSYLDITDPTTLTPFAQVSALKQKEVDLAFKSSRAKFIKNKELLAQTMCQEIAKSLKDSLVEVERTIELTDYILEEAKRIYPEAQTGEGMGAVNKLGIFQRVAKGVILAISPFNYPINLAMAKIIPALVTGNTVVFKPATAGSVLGTLIGQMAKSANLPNGIFNVVTGKGSEIGDLITSNEEIDMISFTGSANVGKRIKTQSKTSDFVFELGGKDPAIVLDDLQLEKYANEIVAGAFGYSGQRCTAIKRVLTSNKIADKLVPILKEKVSKLKVGLAKENADITHVIDNSSADFIQSLIDDAKKMGAKIVIGDKREKNLLYPTLIDNVTVDMKVA
ncbi:hypothetical protein FQR65_LT16609 [Abscondita terminalis]|nr:hypothetical protein FQR65_LT16609 [Abscondita terminalis]